MRTQPLRALVILGLASAMAPDLGCRLDDAERSEEQTGLDSECTTNGEQDRRGRNPGPYEPVVECPEGQANRLGEQASSVFLPSEIPDSPSWCDALTPSDRVELAGQVTMYVGRPLTVGTACPTGPAPVVLALDRQQQWFLVTSSDVTPVASNAIPPATDANYAAVPAEPPDPSPGI